ncbi:hypothetical protein ABIE35_003514 [Paenarthrobacter sp. 4246]
MGSEQARTEYLNIFTQIQALAPGDWTKITPYKPGMACPLPDGTEGTRFNYDSTQGAISEDQAEAIHKTVKEVFESNGLRVVQTQPSGGGEPRPDDHWLCRWHVLHAAWNEQLGHHARRQHPMHTGLLDEI